MLNRRTALIALPLAGFVVLAACGSSSSSGSKATTTAATGGATTTAAAGGATTTAAAGTAVSLKGVCPDKVVVQTDWFPEAEHGATYELMGDDYKASKDTGAVAGSLTVKGKPTGVQLEIRAGGPFLGNQTVVSQMYKDDAILFGYVSTDEAVKFKKDTPTVAVVAPQEKSPQIILWNADKHAGVKTIADIAKVVPTVTVFGGATYIDFLVAQGIVPQAKVDFNYKGDKILTTQDVAHQGFATAEPYQYKTLDTGAINVAYQLIYDTGWQVYPEALSVKKSKLDDAATKTCLKALVPLFQQAQIDFIKAPARASAIIIATNKVYDSFWKYDQGAADYSVKTQLELGIVDNGDDKTLGNFSDARLTDFIKKAIPVFQGEKVDVDPAIKPSDIATNDFIDSSISFTK